MSLPLQTDQLNTLYVHDIVLCSTVSWIDMIPCCAHFCHCLLVLSRLITVWTCAFTAAGGRKFDSTPTLKFTLGWLRNCSNKLIYFSTLPSFFLAFAAQNPFSHHSFSFLGRWVGNLIKSNVRHFNFSVRLDLLHQHLWVLLPLAEA